MKTLNYYLNAARLNLLATSRTAKDGTIDVSAAGRNFPVLSKETLALLTPHQLAVLKTNKKVEALDLDNLQHLPKEEIKIKVVENFDNCIKYLYEQAEYKTNFKNKNDVKGLIKKIACMLGDGIIKPEKWFRQHDSEKFPYTKVEHLDKALDDFCEQFLELILNIPTEEKEQINWARKTAAWVEYRINLTDHFIADSCGKTAAVISTFVYMKVGQSIPIFISKEDYFNKTALPKVINTCKELNSDSQFATWHNYYCQQFSLSEESSIASAEANIEERDYVRAAIDNMLAVSKTLTHQAVSTTAYQTKAALVENYSFATKPVIVANFSTVIEELYAKRNLEFKTAPEVELFISEIVNKINLGLVKTDFSDKKFLRNSNNNQYPYSSCEHLPAAYDNFIKEFHKKLTNKDNNPKKTAAWIEYEICFHHHFFKDGNKRIAISISSFYLMRCNYSLPQYKNLSDWEKSAPTRKIEAVDNIEEDNQFQRWYFNYRKLFKAPLKYELPSPKAHQNPWKISVDEIVYLNGTIYQHITRSRGEIIDLQKATGLEIKELVVFKPERIALHECIVQASTQLILKDDILEKLLAPKGFYRQKVVPEIKFLQESMESLKNNFDHYIKRTLESYLPGACLADKDIKANIDFYRKKIEQRIVEKKYDARVSEINRALKSLVADKMLRDHFQNEICTIVHRLLEDYTNTHNLKLLPVYQNFQRITWAIVGGPAAGKSSLEKEVQRMIKLAENEISFCTVNPDRYKPYLVNQSELSNPYFAALTHVESSYIADQLINRLWMMVKGNRTPHILLDTVKSSENKMSLARFGGATVNLYIASCPVEGPQGAMSRAFNRANTIGVDHGRYVPTCEILNGHKQESLLLPETIDKSRISLHLFNTEPKPSKLAAVIDDYSKHIKIYDPKSFFEFLRKSLICTEAQSEDMIYENALNAEQLVKLLMAYLEKNITLSFRYSENIANPTLAQLKKDKLELSEVGNKKVLHSKLDSNKHLQLFHKKEDSYAILTPDRGFICQNIIVFKNALENMDILLEDFIDELIDYEDASHPHGISIDLSEPNTHLKLFEYNNQQQQFNYNFEQLQTAFPELLLRRRLNIGGNFPQVLDAFSKMPGNTAVSLLVMRAAMEPYLSIKKRISYLSKTLDTEPQNVEALKHRANFYANFPEQLNNALSDIDQAILYDPNKIELYLIRATVLLKKAQPEAAEVDYQIAIDLSPYDVGIYQNRAHAYLSINNYKMALTSFNKIIELMPKKYEAYFEKSKIYFTLGFLDKTIEECNKALACLPENSRSDIYWHLAKCNKNKGMYDEAIADLTKAIECARINHHLLYLERASIYFLTKHFAEAIKDYDQVIMLQPQLLFNIFKDRSLANACIGHTTIARQDIEKIKNVNLNNIIVQLECAVAFLNIGAIDEAIEAYDELENLGSNYPGFLTLSHNLAAILFNIKKQLEKNAKVLIAKAFEKALKTYELFIKANPKDAELYFWRGKLYKHYCKNNHATQDFQKAIKFSPFFRPAYIELIALYKNLAREIPSDKEKYLMQARDVDEKYQQLIESQVDFTSSDIQLCEANEALNTSITSSLITTDTAQSILPLQPISTVSVLPPNSTNKNQSNNLGFFNSNSINSLQQSAGKNNDDLIIIQRTSTLSELSSNQSLEFKKTRKGLKNEDQFINILEQYIPACSKLGEAHDQGDCFFDALAQCLNQINDTNVNTDKYLRMLCHDYYEKNKTFIDKLNAKDYGGTDKHDNYYMVQYTVEECDKDFGGRPPIWGRPYVEGIILCNQLKLRGLCVIEILEHPETKQPIPSFHWVNQENYTTIDEQEAKERLSNLEIPTLVVEQNSLHFVPLLPASLILEPSEEYLSAAMS